MSWGRLASGTASNVNDAQTTDMDTTHAKLLLAHVAWYYGAGVDTVLTDFYNNIWIALPRYAGLFSTASRLYYCINPTVGGGHWIKSAGSGVFQTVWGLALSASGAVTFDQETGLTTDGVTSLQASALTPTTSAAFAISGGTTFPTGASTFDITAAGSLNKEITQYVNGDHLGGGMGERFNDGSAWQPTWDTGGVSGNIAMSNAIFLETVAATGLPFLTQLGGQRQR